MKRVTPEEAENWPHKNVIVRALGMKESVQVDILTEKPHVGDTYVLCSDGLTGMIKDDQMQHIVMSERDLDRCGRAVDHRRERRGRHRQHLGRPRADRGGVKAALALGLALALGGCKKQAARRRRRTDPRGPAIPPVELARGKDACAGYVG